jgi:hypothetical protein
MPSCLAPGARALGEACLHQRSMLPCRGEIVRGLAGHALRHSHMFRLLDDKVGG